MPVPPSPKFQAYDAMTDAPVPGVLAEASNVTGMLINAMLGDIANTAVGAPAGGRITPVGTRRIVTCSGFAVEKLVPVAVATIETQLPGSALQVPKAPFDGGAVYTTVATPLASVTIERAESVPKSCTTPFKTMSTRSGSAGRPLPSGPIAVTLIEDCDPPSWLMLSGIAFSVTVSARPEGPLSAGGVVLLTVQLVVAASRANATAARRIYVNDMALEIPNITELNLQLSHHADRVSRAVRPVERHLGNCRDEVRARAQLRERRLLLGDVPDELESRRQRAAGADGAGDRGVERIWHVGALHVPAVGADVLDVHPVDRDLVVRRRRERRGGARILQRRAQRDGAAVAEDRRAGTGRRARRGRRDVRDDVGDQRARGCAGRRAAADALEQIDHQVHRRAALAHDVTARNAGRDQRGESEESSGTSHIVPCR